MSSHHFVRAEQADCLIIVNQNIDEALFNQLLEWNPVIVATEKTVEWLDSLDIKVDILLSDQIQKTFPYPIEIINQTDILIAIELLERQLKVARITIVGDEDLAQVQDYILKHNNKNISIIENHFKHYLLKKNDTFTKWMSKGAQWFCYPIKAIKTEGAVEIRGEEFTVFKDSKVSIHILENIIFKESI